ncbi:hypothetical protein B0H13DRAFT_1886379 [Mycena leptocephala]|nr:hypothetical protein B0H13DRAFT_1886379 [Mycena leptocephala]
MWRRALTEKLEEHCVRKGMSMSKFKRKLKKRPPSGRRGLPVPVGPSHLKESRDEENSVQKENVRPSSGWFLPECRPGAQELWRRRSTNVVFVVALQVYGSLFYAADLSIHASLPPVFTTAPLSCFGTSFALVPRGPVFSVPRMPAVLASQFFSAARYLSHPGNYGFVSEEKDGIDALPSVYGILPQTRIVQQAEKSTVMRRCTVKP